MSWLRPWIAFGGCVLVVVLLNWAEPVMLPIAVALLLTFLLNPPVNALQRWMGRGPAVVIVVGLTLGALTMLGWGLVSQLTSLAADLPGYRENIRQKVADVRNVSRGGAVEKMQSTLDDIKTEMAKGGPGRSTAQVMVATEPVSGLGVTAWLTSLMSPLGTAALVTVLVIFMLLEQRDMRDRIVALVGYSHLAATTKAFDEAAARLSRYLVMQSLINAIYGLGVGVGLWLFGVPYPLLWGVFAAAFRFIPYLGPWIAAGAPILVSLAAAPGWTTPLYVAGLFVVLELITNLILETVFYAGAAGVTQVALIIALAFWTWLWGPLGLLLATPLTVCLAVLGKHVPGFRGLSMLISDAPMLSPDATYYQRVLARQLPAARELIDRQLSAQAPECVFDTLMLPALNYAERDRLSHRLSLEEERAVIDTTRELTAEVDARLRRPASSLDFTNASETPAGASVRSLGYPVESPADAAALEMLRALVHDLPMSLEIASRQMLLSELVSAVQTGSFGIVCLVDLPPSSASKTRHAVKRLRQACPDVSILVGRWAPESLADESADELLEAGASYVSSTLVESRNHIREIVGHLVSVPASAEK